MSPALARASLGSNADVMEESLMVAARGSLVKLLFACLLVAAIVAIVPVGAPAQEADPCPNGFHFERMSGTGCVQDYELFPEFGHPGYTGSPVCDLGTPVIEWREVKAEVPGQPGAGAFPFLCFCDTELDRNPTQADIARCADLPQLLEDSRIERGLVEPATTTTQETTTTPATTSSTSTTKVQPTTTTTTTAATQPGASQEPKKGLPLPKTAAAAAIVTLAGVLAQGARSGVVRGKVGELVAKGDALPTRVQDRVQKRLDDLRTRVKQRYEEALARLRKHRIVRRPGEIIERGQRRFREAQARLDRRSQRIQERMERRGKEVVDRIGRSRLVRRGRELVDRAQRGIGRLKANYRGVQELHRIVTDKRRLEQEVNRGVGRVVRRGIARSGVSPILVTGLGGEKAIGRSVVRVLHDPRREFRRVGRTLRSPRALVREVGRGVRRVGRAIDKSPPARAARFVFGRQGLGRLFRGRRRR
jgi:hypothetical protein